MGKKNTGLKILIIILGVLVLALSSYIVYAKFLSDDNINNECNCDKEKTKESSYSKVWDHEELNDDLKNELNEVFEFVFYYNDSGNLFCGDYKEGEIIEVSGENPYLQSGFYNSFDEMINYLKGYMTERVIYGKIGSRDNYVEKDGRLYCPDYGKGGSIYELKNIIIKYSKPFDDVIYTNIEAQLVYDELAKYEEVYDVVFEKKGNNWVISTYQMLYSTEYNRK